MKSTEKMEERLERVNMHDFFLKKIDKAIEEERYIEASWLIYSCMENRFFRTLQKYKFLCSKCKNNSCSDSKNKLAISTKIKCIKNLAKANVSCISESFDVDLLDNVQLWLNKRNVMMHELLSLETYQEMDEKFKESALKGKKLLDKLYSSCTTFRSKFYEENYNFVFPEEAIQKCQCKAQGDKKENQKSSKSKSNKGNNSKNIGNSKKVKVSNK